MKKLFLTLVLMFSTLIFSFNGFAEWTKITESIDGNKFYIDFERIRKAGNYIYYWELRDYPKVDEYGDLSSKKYIEADCKIFRYKYLMDSYHVQRMGKGKPSTSSNKPDKDWRYPIPNTVGETIMKTICNTSN